MSDTERLAVGEGKTELVPAKELLPYLVEKLAAGWMVRSVQVQVLLDGGQWLAPTDWNYWVRLMRELPAEMQPGEARAERERRV